MLPSDTASPPAELRDESPRRTRRAHRRIRPVRPLFMCILLVKSGTRPDVTFGKFYLYFFSISIMNNENKSLKIILKNVCIALNCLEEMFWASKQPN